MKLKAFFIIVASIFVIGLFCGDSKVVNLLVLIVLSATAALTFYLIETMDDKLYHVARKIDAMADSVNKKTDFEEAVCKNSVLALQKDIDLLKGKMDEILWRHITKSL